MPYWFLIALIAPFLWALVAIIDTYFVHDIYEDEYDGTLLSGLFQALPWFLVPIGMIDFTFPTLEVSQWAFAAGALFILSFFYYFRALFVFNDSALMQTLWGLSVLVVPFFMWLFFHEVLRPAHYIGILVAFVGIFLFHFDKRVQQVGFLRVIGLMLLSVVFYSASMVIGKRAYESDGGDFWSIFLIFSLGAALTAIGIVILRKKPIFEKLKKIITLSRRYFLFFSFSEGISLIATVASQKAISLSPTVTFVIVIESLVPVFVMLISFFIVMMFRSTLKQTTTAIYQEQFSRLRIKLMAIAAITFGIYAISLPL